MPTYVYRRTDGSTFEIEQRITEAPLQTCPTTGQAVERVITGGAGLIFKGSGFYLTDYARKNGENEKSTPKETSAAKPEAKKETKESSSSDTSSSAA